MWNFVKPKNLTFSEYQEQISNQYKDDNAILALFDTSKYENKEGRLANVTFTIKDNYATEEGVTTSGSRLLKNFKPQYNSTVFQKLIDEGAVPLFKANLDELAMGGTGTTSGFGIVPNPIDRTKQVGGSSSGSAFLQAIDAVDFSIGSDTGDSVRKPAAYINRIGFKPSWGLISRYGISEFAASLDTVSYFTNTVEQAALLLEILQGKDEQDLTANEDNTKFSEELNTNKKYKIGYWPNLVSNLKDKTIETDITLLADKLKADGHELLEMKLHDDLFDAMLAVYRIVALTEAISINSNLTGFLFGESGKGKDFNEQSINTRSENFEYEVKKRMLWGAYSAYESDLYKRALDIKEQLIIEVNEVFERMDAILLPSTPIKGNNMDGTSSSESPLDDYLWMFNANGSPSITVPITSTTVINTSVNIATAKGQDLECLRLAKIVEGYNE